MVKKFVDNVWWKFIIGLLAIFGFFGIKGSDFMTFLSNASWLFDAIVLSLLWGAFIFGIHSYLRSERNRKDMIILNSRLDGQFKKIDTQFESVAKEFKALEKGLSSVVDLVEKNREYIEERLKYLYEEINKKQDKDP